MESKYYIVELIDENCIYCNYIPYGDINEAMVVSKERTIAKGTPHFVANWNALNAIDSKKFAIEKYI